MRITPMKHVAIAAAWLIGSTVPLALAVVFFFGCCVLPFHQTLHKLAPLCSIASLITRSEESAGVPSTPAREKSEKTGRKSVPSLLPQHAELSMSDRGVQHFVPARLRYRSVIALGAMRCDDDVGLRLSLLDTFRI